MALEEMGWQPERRESRIKAVPYVSIGPQESQNTLNASALRSVYTRAPPTRKSLHPPKSSRTSQKIIRPGGLVRQVTRSRGFS